ncbi:hypothetical protein BN871_BK_00350 [Paenibacillus sp. P22]|nr:hypothetical protein BN871_BK_00350 [Paenibacillus sp. P22]
MMSSKRVNSTFMYALGMFAIMVPSQAFTSFYSYYYVEKLGLGIGLATLARSVYLVWDAVNQPLLGYWSDRTRSPRGRRKPWLYGGLPAFAILFVLMFSVPPGLSGASAAGELFWWFLIVLILFESASSVLWVNYGSLLPELFAGAALRAKASAVQQSFQMLAILIGTAATPLLFKAVGFSGMSVAYAALFLLCMLVFLKHLQESPRSPRPVSAAAAASFPRNAAQPQLLDFPSGEFVRPNGERAAQLHDSVLCQVCPAYSGEPGFHSACLRIRFRHSAGRGLVSHCPASRRLAQLAAVACRVRSHGDSALVRGKPGDGDRGGNLDRLRSGRISGDSGGAERAYHRSGCGAHRAAAGGGLYRSRRVHQPFQRAHIRCGFLDCRPHVRLCQRP